MISGEFQKRSFTGAMESRMALAGHFRFFGDLG